MCGIVLEVQPFARRSCYRQKVAKGITIHAVHIARRVREACKDGDVLRQRLWTIGHVELPAVIARDRPGVPLVYRSRIIAVPCDVGVSSRQTDRMLEVNSPSVRQD